MPHHLFIVYKDVKKMSNAVNVSTEQLRALECLVQWVSVSEYILEFWVTEIGGGEMGSMYVQSQEARWYVHEELA